jgi:hypothetical protein
LAKPIKLNRSRRRRATTTGDSYQDMLNRVDVSRLNARGRAALEEMRRNPRIAANAVPSVRSFIRMLRGGQNTEAYGIPPWQRVLGEVAKTLSGYTPFQPAPPLKKRVLPSVRKNPNDTFVPTVRLDPSMVNDARLTTGFRANPELKITNRGRFQGFGSGLAAEKSRRRKHLKRSASSQRTRYSAR